ncbi:MAG TPA: cell wall-binding repeat-containing protein [Nitriliruptorales bacterium]
MITANLRLLSPVLALALLASMLAVSAGSRAADSAYDNVERIDVSSYTAAGIAVSKRVFPDGADAAVLTRDDHFPDALAASALAKKVDGPVLFTATGTLTSSTAAELDRILDAGDTVYITGGPVAVSENVANQVRARGYEVVRLDGETRVETAVAIADLVKVPTDGHVLIARAFGPAGKDRTVGWVDSVTCGAYANHTQTPILLTRTEALDAATATALDDLGATKVTICGGPAAVSQATAQQLRDQGLTVARASGDTRVETAVDAAKKLFGSTSAADGTYVLVNGYGENFGWGVAVTPLAGALGAPILLVGPDQPTSCTDTSQAARNTLCYLETVGDGSADLIVFGNAGLVGDAVRDAAAKAAGGKVTTSDPGTDPDGALATPTSVTTSNVSTPSEGRVTVRWKAVSDADSRLKGYNVYYGKDSAGTRARGGATTVGPNATSFTVGALQLDTTYHFAVTSVTDDGQESAKSAQVSEKTTAPSVDLTAPTSASPRGVQPSSKTPVEFQYAASEGGTFQLFHRLAGSDTWKAFPETPNANPATVPASQDGKRTINVTTPGAEGTYDLRVVLRPTGSDAVQDVEVGALDVATPKVTLDQPTELNKTEVLPGATDVEVVFSYETNSDGTYTVSLRGPDLPATDPWTTDVAEGAAPAGDVTGKTVTFDAPADEGFYDVRVRIGTESGETHDAIEQGVLHVVTPEIALTAPSAPTLLAAGADPGLTFETNAAGNWNAQYRSADATEPWEDAESWTTFTGTGTSGSGAEGQTGTGGGAPPPLDVAAPTEVGTYDVSVVLTPEADPANPVRSSSEAGAAVLNVATVTLDGPTSASPATPDPGGDFTVEFTLDTPVPVEYHVEARVAGTSDAWSSLHDQEGAKTPTHTDGTQPNEVTLNAPSDANDYDLRIRVVPTEGTGELAALQLGALQVQRAAPTVQFTDPTAGNPVQVLGDQTFEVTFDPDFTGTFEITRSDPAGGPQILADGEVTQPDVDLNSKTVTELQAPARDESPANNTYDLTVTLTDPTPGGFGTEEDPVTAGLRVADVVVSQPTGSGDTKTGGQTFTVEFDLNVTGSYIIQEKKDDGSDTYEPIKNPDDTDATGSVDLADADGTAPIQHEVRAPQADSADQTYDIQVRLTLGDGTSEVAGASQFTVPGSGNGTASVDQNPVAVPSVTTPGEEVTITFIASYSGSSATYALAYSSDGATWTAFEGDAPSGTAAASGQPTSPRVDAPATEGTYDLKVTIVSDDGATVEGETEDGLTVASEPGNGTSLGILSVSISGDSTATVGSPLVLEVTVTNNGSAEEIDLGVKYSPNPATGGTRRAVAGDVQGCPPQAQGSARYALTPGGWVCFDLLLELTTGTLQGEFPEPSTLTVPTGDTTVQLETTFRKTGTWTVEVCVVDRLATDADTSSTTRIVCRADAESGVHQIVVT